MEQVKRIFVSLQFDAEEIEVDELVSDEKLIYFKYYRSALMKLATYFNVKNANAILEEVLNVVNNWRKYAVSSGVRSTSKNSIQRVIGR